MKQKHNTMLVTLSTFFLLFVLTACSTNTDASELTGQVIGEEEQEELAGQEDQVNEPGSEMTLDEANEQSSSAEEQSVKDFQVYLKRTVDRNGVVESERLFPSLFAVEQGDVVQLVFMFDTPRFISIEGIGFAEHVQGELVEFVASQKGVFSMMCLDCPNSYESVLIVE